MSASVMARRWLVPGLAWSVFALGLSGCNGGDDVVTGTVGNSGHDVASGSVTLRVTDGPIADLEAVNIQLTGVTLHRAEGADVSFALDPPRTIDLMAQDRGASEVVLDAAVVPAGHYPWVRLHVNAERGVMDSYVVLESGGERSLYMPGDERRDLKLVGGLDVAPGGSADRAVEFHLRSGVHRPSGPYTDYVHRPVLRWVDATRDGLLRGRVASSLLYAGADPACPPSTATPDGAVYVFEGAGVTPDDIDARPREPVTSADVELDAETGSFDYVVGFLEPGDYTIALTCRASEDEPRQDDAIAFIETHDVSIVRDATTRQDFGNP